MEKAERSWPPFAAREELRQNPLRRRSVDTVQINIGKLCNQTCFHCHVDAGPHKKRENMTGETVERLMTLLKEAGTVTSVDITGGAPELNPHFRFLVKECRSLNISVIDRCNLTVLFEPKQEDTASFLAENRVRVVASLPCYSRENVEKQRGDGVFDKSIRGLQLLNSLGYGKQSDKDIDHKNPLSLDLVYNPIGPSLPPPQETLQEDYRKRLREDFGITFSRLLTITNMPIKRFLFDLRKTGRYTGYMNLLSNAFNAGVLDQVMCRNLVSVSWDGKIYDCDFNQMLNMPVMGKLKTIWDIGSFNSLAKEPIQVADHCYGCTAGAGSSCGGAIGA